MSRFTCPYVVLLLPLCMDIFSEAGMINLAAVNVTFEAKKPVNITCSVPNIDNITVVWRKKGIMVPISVGELQLMYSERFNVYRDENVSILNLKNPIAFDSGVYYCLFTPNRVDVYTTEFILRRKEKSYTDIEAGKVKVGAFAGENVSLPCVVKRKHKKKLNLKGIYCGCNITLDVGSCVTWSKTKRNYSVATQFCTGNHGNLITVNDICNHDIVHQLLSSVEAEQTWIDYDGDVSDRNWCPRYDSGRKQREEVSCSKEHHFFCYYNESGCTNSTDNFKRVIIEPRRTFIPDITTSTHSTDEITIFPDNSSVAEKGNYTVIAFIGVYLVGVTVLIITGIAVVKIKERRKKHAANFTEEAYARIADIGPRGVSCSLERKIRALTPSVIA